MYYDIQVIPHCVVCFRFLDLSSDRERDGQLWVGRSDVSVTVDKKKRTSIATGFTLAYLHPALFVVPFTVRREATFSFVVLPAETGG